MLFPFDRLVKNISSPTSQGRIASCPYKKIQDYQDAINLKNKRDRSERLHPCDFVTRININNLSRNPTR